MIANKYACMSQTEYRKCMLQTNAQKVQKNMNLLHLVNSTFFASNVDDPLYQQTRDFEIAGAIMRSGVDLRANRKFVIKKPTNAHDEEALNFRRWQALLLGKRHLAEFDAQKVHPLLKNTFEATTVDGIECFQLDIYEVMRSILNWRNSVEFSPFLTRLARYYPVVVVSVPFLSILRFESLLHHYGIHLYPLPDNNNYEEGGNSTGKDFSLCPCCSCGPTSCMSH